MGGLSAERNTVYFFSLSEDVELTRLQMPPGSNDVEFFGRQAGRVFFAEGLDQLGVVHEGIPHLESDGWRQAGELFRRGRLVGDNPEALVHEEHQRSV